MHLAPGQTAHLPAPRYTLGPGAVKQSSLPGSVSGEEDLQG